MSPSTWSRRPLVAALAVLAVVAACDGGTGGATDAAPDAPTDGPPPIPRLLRVEPAPCAGTADPATFPAVVPGQRVIRELELFNDDDAFMAVTGVVIEGADAADFTVARPAESVDQDHCTHTLLGQDAHYVLGRGSCRLRITYAPTGPGPKQARVHLTSIGLDQVVPLAAPARVDPAPALSAGIAEYYFPRFGTVTLQITNTGQSPIVIGDPVLPPGFTISSMLPWNCPATMTPGAACTAVVYFQPPDPRGCFAGDLTTSGPDSDLRVALRGAGYQPLLVVDAAGDGRVTSTPTGIDCGPAAVCHHSFAGAPMVTLTATTTAHFTGWNERKRWFYLDRSGESVNPCGTDPICVVPSDSFYAQALFASPAARRIAITIVGSGRVRAAWSAAEERSVVCDASCQLYVEPGTAVALTAIDGPFTGWTGDCAGAGPTCSLGDVIADRAVTATF